MAYAVRFTQAAHEDLRELHTYISANDSRENANHVTREIVRAALALQNSLPDSGKYRQCCTDCRRAMGQCSLAGNSRTHSVK
jgi:plasmid stabilization system protein ParE